MREIERVGLVRIMRAWPRYLVLVGSVVIAARWTKRAARRTAFPGVEEDNR